MTLVLIDYMYKKAQLCCAFLIFKGTDKIYFPYRLRPSIVLQDFTKLTIK